MRLGTYENWSNELTVQNIWFATPSIDLDVVTLANWAYANNFTLRASAFMHNWSPLTLTESNHFVKNVVLVETTKTFINMEVTSSPYPNTKAVTVGTGVSMLDLLTFMEKNGLGVYSAPAPGGISVGGVLGIGGHGTSVLAVGERQAPGFSYGTISNLVIRLTAVVWDPVEEAYVLKTFRRSETDTKAFLVHLGRTFITEVTLMAGPNYNLRCQSRADILSDELFADPANVKVNSRTFAHFLDQTGRIETILFPFSSTPWLKIWSICPKRPSLLTRKVNHPYNFLLTNIFPEFLSMVVGNVTIALRPLNPLLGPAQSLLSTVNNLATLSFDLWGPSKNLLLYVEDSTFRQTACGHAIITTRANVQKVVSQLSTCYNAILREYSAMNLYPINGVLEMRASALDQSKTVVPDGESPSLSVLHPVNDHPEYDTAVWVSIVTFADAPHQNEALRKFERFIYDNIDGAGAVVRAEWSKGYAYTEKGAWTDDSVLKKFVPSKFPDTSNSDGWNFAISTFDKYDPHRIFTNEFLNKLLVKV